MKRVQLFEFEDFSWFPSGFRSTMTKLIVVLLKLMGVKEVIASIISGIQKQHPFTKIVDLGSGSGGIMPDVVSHLNESNTDAKIELLLTDLHPNEKFVTQFNEQKLENMSYSETPVDASKYTGEIQGLKTMMNSFHHMRPEIAKNILKNAQETKQPLMVYEMIENKIPLLLWVILLPISLTITGLMSLLFLPFVKPLNWKDVLFTYFIPVIPFFYAWDGQASMPRVYTFSDIENELLPPKDENYVWEIKEAKKENGKVLGYYILGLPV